MAVWTAAGMSAATIVLAAGGTGGHVFPAEALARELSGRGHSLVLVTDARGAVYGGALAELPVHRIQAGTPAAGSVGARIAGLFRAAVGTWQARRLLQRIAPDAVVGFGGYPSLPTVLAAVTLGIPTVLHEQNAVLGKANRFLAPRVSAVALSFSATRRLRDNDQPRAEVIGNPVRAEVLAVRDAAYAAPDAQGPVRMFVLGGSQGAEVLSDVVPRAVALLPPEVRARLHVAQQCRPETLGMARRGYASAKVKAELSAFFHDVPRRLKKAHLVICRAGASTVSEIAVSGRPAVFVPLPHASDGHQAANAVALVDAGGGWLIPQPEFTPEGLAALLARLFAVPHELSAAAAASRSAGRPAAAHDLAELAERLMARRLSQVSGEPMRAAPRGERSAAE